MVNYHPHRKPRVDLVLRKESDISERYVFLDKPIIFSEYITDIEGEEDGRG